VLDLGVRKLREDGQAEAGFCRAFGPREGTGTSAQGRVTRLQVQGPGINEIRADLEPRQVFAQLIPPRMQQGELVKNRSSVRLTSR
jgi:hypothetical protein